MAVYREGGAQSGLALPALIPAGIQEGTACLDYRIGKKPASGGRDRPRGSCAVTSNAKLLGAATAPGAEPEYAGQPRRRGDARHAAPVEPRVHPSGG